jgi:carboxypeptidase family protein
VTAGAMRPLSILALVAIVPAPAFAQAAMAGSVRDVSGMPVPGVTVQAASPALIEKARLAVTDTGGRYRIEDLQPGTYSITFTLKGWRPYVRQGIELSGSSTAVVNAELAIGPLTEAITVTGALPVVDSHSLTRELTLGGDVVRSIPTARSYNALLVIVPGIVTTSNDVVTGTATTSFPIHGGRTNEGRLTLDGLNIGSPPSGNSATSYVVDLGTSQEVTFSTATALGETETGGLVMNIVPRSGGNTVRGSVFASGSGDALQSDNLTPALRDQGVTVATPLTGVYDVSATLGGPIARNRLWYFVNAHAGSTTKASANVFYNLNAGAPSKWLYAPDRTRPEYSDRTFENASARVTWQITARHKVSAFWDAQALCRTCTGATPGLAEPARVSPEAVGVLGRPLNVAQVTWSAPLTHRLLADAGFGATFFGVGNFEREPNPTRGLIRVAEQCASGCAANGNIPGLVYRSQDFSIAHTGSYLGRAALTYVMGAHSLKVGYQHTFMTDDRTWITNDQNLTYQFNNGVPNQLTQSISPWVNDARVAWQGLFAQDQWTRNRLTLQGAVRFDRAWSWFPAQQEGPSRFLPEPIVIPETRGVDSYKDITLRMGAAYDVTGNGRTALKVTLGKYLEGAGVSGIYANTNPTLRLPQTTSVFGTAGVTRTWTDANQNFVPDCDLMNPAAQDLRAGGGDFCGVLSNTSFGRNVLTSNFDPGLRAGWGIRPSDWHLGLSLEQQIGSRSSVALTYTRRWYDGFSVVDNRALQPSDLTPFSILAPADPRLPLGGGYLISGLYDVVPEKAGAVDNFVTSAAPYGNWYQHFNGLDVTVRVRSLKGLSVAAGTSTGQTVADNCDVRASLPELATTTTGTTGFGPGLAASAVMPASPYCHAAFGVLTQLRGFTSYIIPKVGLQLAATFQSKPGPMLAANYAVPNAAVLPSLGRDLSRSAANVTVNLIAPGTLYGDRINQLDVRVSKTLGRGRLRTFLALDTYNALNSSAVLSYNPAFVPGGTWKQPLTIMTPRLIKISAEIEF